MEIALRFTVCPLQLIRIDHVSLDVRDRPVSTAGYQAVVGVRSSAHHDVPDEPIFLGPPGQRQGDSDSISFRDPDGSTLDVMVPGR